MAAQRRTKTKGQITIEYIVLYAIVVALVLAGFKAFVTRAREHGEEYFKDVNKGINANTESFN